MTFPLLRYKCHEGNPSQVLPQSGKHTEAQKDMRMKMVGGGSVNSCRQYANCPHLQATAMLNKTKEIN